MRYIQGMRWSVVAALLLAACGTAPAPAHASLADLRARPLAHLTSGGCHSDGFLENLRQFRFNTSFMNYGDAGGAVSLTGPGLAVGGTATITLASHGYGGPVLVRVRRLDQPGDGGLSVLPKSAGPPVPKRSGGPALSMPLALGREAALPAGPENRTWQALVRVPVAGCWAFQVEGDTLSELIVFTPQRPAVSPRPIVAPSQPFVPPSPPSLTPRWLPAGMHQAPAPFGASYVDATNSRSLVLDNLVPSPPRTGTSVIRAFRNDRGAVYHFEGDSRLLTWKEADGTAFEMRASGLGDADFWHIAGSLG